MQKDKGLSHARLLEANKDPGKAAKAASLVYVTAGSRGFSRQKEGKEFVYFSRTKILRTKSTWNE